MAKTLSVEVDVRQIETLAKNLTRVNAEVIGDASVVAINDVLDEVFETSRDRMLAGGVNLDDPYLRRQMSVRKASNSRPVGELTTHGKQTGLSKFTPQPVAVKAKSPVSRLKGNPALGLGRGQKLGGVSVGVKEGSRKVIQSNDVFMTRGVLDTDGNPFVFRRLPGKTRNGKSRLERLLSLTPYQLFNSNLDAISYDAEERLEAELVSKVGEALEKAFEP